MAGAGDDVARGEARQLRPRCRTAATQSGSKRTAGWSQILLHRRRRARAARRPRGSAASSSRPPSRRAPRRPGWRRSTQKNTSPGTTLREFGRFSISPTVRDAERRMRARDRVDALDQARGAEQRVLAQMHRRRAGVRVLAGDRRLVPAHRLHAGDDADVLALGLQDRPLLDVQFEERRQRMRAAALGAAIADARPAPRRTSRRRGPCARMRPVALEHAWRTRRRRPSRAQSASPPRWSSSPPRSARRSRSRPRPACAALRAPPARRARRRTCRRSAGCRDGCRSRSAARRPCPARRANIAPMSSTVTRQPSASARALNQSRTCRSRSVSVSRQMPPFGVPPIAAVSISSPHSRSASMARLRMRARSGPRALALGGRRPQLRPDAQILLGARHLGAERLRRVPAPARIVEHARAPCATMSALPLGDDRFGLFGR